MKKLNRQVVRSEHRVEMNEKSDQREVLKAPTQEQTPRQAKKQAKQRKAKENGSRTHIALTPEEKNPLARQVQKKTPRI